MKRTTKFAAVLTVGATTAIGVVLATGPVSAAAGGGSGSGSGSPQNGAGGYSTMMGSGGYGRGGMMNGWTGSGTGSGTWTGGGMMNGYGPGMMGGSATGTNMGAMMGRMLANVAGPRVSTAQAAADANAVPPGASVDVAGNRLIFTGDTVILTLVAGTNEKNDYAFEAAGLTNPQIVVPAGARVTLRLVNADTDTAHGVLVTTTDTAATTWMPMMTSTVAFPGAAIWALGVAGSSGAPTATTSFTAATPGTYTYLCAVPGHAQQGMHGTFTVR